VAEFQLMFNRLHNNLEKKMLVIEWMRSNPSLRQLCRIPYILHEEDDPQDFLPLRKSLVCAIEMMDLLCKSYWWWEELSRSQPKHDYA
jgi:hypothetical protein